MSVTPQTNATLEEIAEVLLRSDDICICGHVSPDGDCIGSQLALFHALKRLGKNAYVLLASEGPADVALSALPGFSEMVVASYFTDPYSVFVQVDAPNGKRIGEAADKLRANATLTVTVDHHENPERETDLSYTDPDAPSTTTLIWELVKKMGVSPDSDIATCAYAGLMTDTGRFQYSNADARAFELASEMVRAGADPASISAEFYQRQSLASLQMQKMCIEHLQMLCSGRAALSYVTASEMTAAGADKSDCEQLINVIRSVDGVRVAAMLRDEGVHVRGSLRAKDDTDVSAIAKKFGGGGHRAAAGFTLHEPLDKAIRIVKKEIEKVLAKDPH